MVEGIENYEDEEKHGEPLPREITLTTEEIRALRFEKFMATYGSGHPTLRYKIYLRGCIYEVPPHVISALKRTLDSSPNLVRVKISRLGIGLRTRYLVEPACEPTRAKEVSSERLRMIALRHEKNFEGWTRRKSRR